MSNYCRNTELIFILAYPRCGQTRLSVCSLSNFALKENNLSFLKKNNNSALVFKLWQKFSCIILLKPLDSIIFSPLQIREKKCTRLPTVHCLKFYNIMTLIWSSGNSRSSSLPQYGGIKQIGGKHFKSCSW